MYKGIILSEIQRDAFLAVAHYDGLICEKGETDGVYRRRTARQPEYPLLKRVFEQFVVAGKVYVDPFTYKCLDGELIEQEIILPYKEAKHDIEFQYFDISTVQKLLLEKGLSIDEYTEERIIDTFEKLREKAMEYFAFEAECGLDYMEICVQRSLGIGIARDSKNQSTIDYYFQLRNEIFHNPIYNALAEYRHLMNTAYHNDLLCPLVNFSDPETRTPVIGSDQAVTILKYTSNRLSKSGIAGTLAENVRLVQSEEAKAYRNKVNDWMSALSSQDYGNMQKIEDDIVKAQRAMKCKKFFEFTGFLCATIGIPATVLTHSFDCVLLSRIAEVTTYVGGGTTIIDPTKRKKYLWASFGLK